MWLTFSIADTSPPQRKRSTAKSVICHELSIILEEISPIKKSKSAESTKPVAVLSPAKSNNVRCSTTQSKTVAASKSVRANLFGSPARSSLKYKRKSVVNKRDTLDTELEKIAEDANNIDSRQNGLDSLDTKLENIAKDSSLTHKGGVSKHLFSAPEGKGKLQKQDEIAKECKENRPTPVKTPVRNNNYYHASPTSITKIRALNFSPTRNSESILSPRKSSPLSSTMSSLTPCSPRRHLDMSPTRQRFVSPRKRALFRDNALSPNKDVTASPRKLLSPRKRLLESPRKLASPLRLARQEGMYVSIYRMYVSI